MAYCKLHTTVTLVYRVVVFLSTGWLFLLMLASLPAFEYTLVCFGGSLGCLGDPLRVRVSTLRVMGSPLPWWVLPFVLWRVHVQLAIGAVVTGMGRGFYKKGGGVALTASAGGMWHPTIIFMAAQPVSFIVPLTLQRSVSPHLPWLLSQYDESAVIPFTLQQSIQVQRK